MKIKTRPVLTGVIKIIQDRLWTSITKKHEGFWTGVMKIIKDLFWTSLWKTRRISQNNTRQVLDRFYFNNTQLVLARFFKKVWMGVCKAVLRIAYSGGKKAQQLLRVWPAEEDSVVVLCIILKCVGVSWWLCYVVCVQLVLNSSFLL